MVESSGPDPSTGRGAPGDRSRVARGRHGEAVAARWYEAQGFSVVARNWRDGRRGELDLVARRGRLLVVCEVKARSGGAFGTGFEAVTPAKQATIRRVTAAFLASAELGGWVDVRFDVAVVDARGRIEVLPGAF
jgi:putative endonuclease